MYCAYPVPGMGSNSLMYYYNGKSVSRHFGNVCVRQRGAKRSERMCMRVFAFVTLFLLPSLSAVSFLLYLSPCPSLYVGTCL